MKNNPFNEQGQAHGLWEAYYSMYGNIWYKVHYINGNAFGLYQNFNHESKLLKKEYYAR
jgi:hypothetical protein